MEDKPKIRLIAVDLDGTLLTSKSVLAPEGARLLNEATRDGIYVVLATGRIIDSVRVLCRTLETSSPVICTSGAQIYDSLGGTVWKSITFPRYVGLEIASLADAHGWELSTTIGATTYLRQRPGQPLGPLSELPGRVVVSRNIDGVVDDPTRVLVFEPDGIEKILSLCLSRYADRCCIDPTHGPDGKLSSLGVFAREASKGNALDWILQHLGVSQSEVMAIGNDDNDLSMFSRAHIKIAMGDAQAELKNQATVVAPGNDEEGVAWALKEFGVSR